LEPHGWLCKVDYRRCFFNIPLHPAMYEYVGVSWEGKLWEATRVVFGITVGPHIASIFTAETALVCRRNGIPGSVYIDDNAITGPTERVCLARRASALKIMEIAGWPVAEDKLAEDRPAQRLAYRGVVFDTCAETLSIPLSRLEATRRRVHEVVATRPADVVQVRRLKEIYGRLEWINQVLPMGRARTKRCYGALPYGNKNQWRVHVWGGGRSFCRRRVHRQGHASGPASLPLCRQLQSVGSFLMRPERLGLGQPRGVGS
jgi:hypothetical protein